ncbi:MAG: type II secretion system protein [Phycisphaerae bacterium]|nr:type II secretion system protein [Phycisphaerae bacterium]
MHNDACRYDLRREQQPGFTLIEILVVIACIATLVGIVVPAMSSARQRANEVVCAVRLREWGMAFSAYANGNDGFWPHCDGLDRGPRELDDPHVTKEDAADWYGWVDVLPPLVGLKPWRDHPRYQRPGAETFYQCASGQPVPGQGVYSYRPEREGYFSYAMNSCLELDTNAWPPPGGEGYPMPSFLNTGQLAWSSRVILLFEQLLDPSKGFDGNEVYRSAGEHCGSYPKSFSARHRRGGEALGGNVLYADGHVEWHRSLWKPEWDVDQEVPPRDDVNWYPYPVCEER